MSEQKEHDENFRLRGETPRSTGINKTKFLIFIQVLGMSLAVIIILAFWPKTDRSIARTENFEDKEYQPEGLNRLPTDYNLSSKSGNDNNNKSRSFLYNYEGNHKPRVIDKDELQARRSKLLYSIRPQRRPASAYETKQNSANLSERLENLKNGLSLPELPGDHYKDGVAQNPEKDHGRQFRKLAFLNKKPSGKITNRFGMQKLLSPYTISGGTIINAALISGLNSDLPGQIMAQVTQNIFDTKTGHYLLIPQGSRLIGRYDSVIAFGQDRVLIAWKRIILPNGTSLVIDNLPASDQSGYAGIKDQTDNHTWDKVKGIILATVLSIGTELKIGSSNNELVSAIRDATQDNISSATDKMVDKYLNRQATLTVRPGWPLTVIVNKDLILEPYLNQFEK